MSDAVGEFVERYADVDLALGEVVTAALRAFFQNWIAELDLGEY